MGELVNSGTPPPHRCQRGLPSLHEHNYGAVWRCDCGKFWKKATAYHYDDYWPFPEWVEVKDAAGTEWATEEVPREQYITATGWFRATCRDHGRVRKDHVHTRRA